MTAQPADNPRAGIAFICFGMLCISINDALIKQLSDQYPLHQMVLIRAAVGLAFSMVLLQFEGGFPALRTKTPGLHLLRGICIVIANLAYFAALASIPLADATALFYVAPLFITLLSIPILGEKVGVRRWTAVLIGFLGVLVMLRPGGEIAGDGNRLILMLPVFSAFAYALMQILTRKLGVASKASAMAAYTQATFIAVSSAFWFAAGDGRYAEGVDSPSLIFLLRAWVWPTPEEWPLLLFLGLLSGATGYSMARAYRSADVATIAPFEYLALPMAIFLGWLMFDHLPGPWVISGSALIACSGVYVFLREKQRARPNASKRPFRRV